MLRNLLILVVLATIAVALSFTLESAPPVPAPENPSSDNHTDMPLPAFTFTPWGSDSILQSESLRGRVVLLNFWASWCGVCKSEKPSLAQLSSELTSDDFVVITLASDRQWVDILYSLMASLAADKLDPALPADASMAQMLAAYKQAMPAGTPFHVFLDEPASEDTQIGAIATAWGVGAVPESFLIDKAGRIRAYYVNSRDWNLGVARRCLRSVIDE